MSIDKWLDKEVVVHIYNGILLSHKNDWIWVNWTDVDEPTACYTNEVSQRKILYINTYICNLEKWYWWIYVQGRNRDTYILNGLVDTEGEGEGRAIWENSIDM